MRVYEREEEAKHDLDLMEEGMDYRICPFMRGNCDRTCLFREPGRIISADENGEKRWEILRPSCRLVQLVEQLLERF